MMLFSSFLDLKTCFGLRIKTKPLKFDECLLSRLVMNSGVSLAIIL